jgi:hypothetical protein
MNPRIARALIDDLKKRGIHEGRIEFNDDDYNYVVEVLALAYKGTGFTGLEGATQRKSSLSGTLNHLREVQVKFPDATSPAVANHISTQ